MMCTEYYNSEAFTQWDSQESGPEFQRMLQASDPRGRPNISSPKKVKPIDVVMEEFKMNGFDSPYDPDEELNIYNNNNNRNKTGLVSRALPNTFIRQWSWPDPAATPAVPLRAPLRAPPRAPLPAPLLAPRARDYAAPCNVEIVAPSAPEVFTPNIPAYVEEPLPPASELLTEQQFRVLKSLPDAVVYLLLKQMEQQGYGQRGHRRAREPDVAECRFCKNNGEKEQFYRSHRLRTDGRVSCPVLRDYHCPRCGATGDYAHTYKYCPLTTDDERMKSKNMMRSIRQGSNRRRSWIAPSTEIAGTGGKNRNVTLTDGVAYNMYEPLDPVWEEVAKNLAMSLLLK